MHSLASRRSGAWSAAPLIGLSVFAGLAAWQACLPARHESPVTIVYLGSMPAGPAEFDLRQRLLRPFTAKTGIQVKFISGPGSVTERLDLYMRYLESKSATPDVYLLDETFPGALAEHLLDLEPYLGIEARQHVSEAVDHNRVGGKLVGLPLAIDAGLLYYRSDLLRKYGYWRPPETWSEMQQMATRIQAGERAAGDRDFWGYVWQGARYEGLTCNALEWQASSGGGSLIEGNGTLALNNPATIGALTRARGWVGSISPPEVTSYDESDSEKVWLAGHAAFARRWFVDTDRTLRRGEPGAALESASFTALPSGGAGRVSVDGSMSLSVSRYATHPSEAVEFIRYLTSHDVQLQFLSELSLASSREEFYRPPDSDRAPGLKRLREVFASSVIARPSRIAGKRYPEVSRAYFSAVHSVLTGEVSAGKAMADLESELARITGFNSGKPGLQPEPGAR